MALRATQGHEGGQAIRLTLPRMRAERHRASLARGAKHAPASTEYPMALRATQGHEGGQAIRLPLPAYARGAACGKFRLAGESGPGKLKACPTFDARRAAYAVRNRRAGWTGAVAGRGLAVRVPRCSRIAGFSSLPTSSWRMAFRSTKSAPSAVRA